MTIENFLPIAVLIMLIVLFRAWKFRQAEVDAHQQAKQVEEAERVLSATLTATKSSYTSNLGDLPLNLTAGERALAVLPGTTLLEVRSVTKRRGSWGGPTIRVAKGLSFRLGSSESVAESHQEIRNVDQGTLVVTNERIAFIGEFRTISAKWGKIIGVNAFSDAVGLHFEGENKPIYFQPSSAVTLTYTLADKEHKLPVNARFLKAAIDVARKGGAPRLERQVHQAKLVIASTGSAADLLGIAMLMDRKVDFVCCDNPTATKFTIDCRASPPVK